MASKRLVALAVCVFVGCSADPVPEPTGDADASSDNISPGPDATVPDPNVPDAAGPNVPDAAPPQPDAASEPDAAADAEGDVAPEDGSGCLNNDCTLNVLVLGDEPGITASGVFSQDPTEVRNRPVMTTGTATEECRVSGPFPVKTYYAFIEVRNTTAEDATVDLYIDTAPAEFDGAIYAFSHLAAYGAVPQTDTEADDCLTGVNQKCSDETASSDPRWPCLIDEYAPVVPASGSIWVYLGLHSPPTQPAGEVPLSFELRAARR